jgi:hypothetical protein
MAAGGGMTGGGAGVAVRPAPGVGGSVVAGGGNWSGRGNWAGGGYRHHHHRHGGFWPGFAIGAGVGSAYGYYGNNYYYDDPYYYDETVVAAAPPVGDDAVAYCMRRYKSYDPASGTYLGYDGQRHPCPAQ